MDSQSLQKFLSGKLCNENFDMQITSQLDVFNLACNKIAFKYSLRDNIVISEVMDFCLGNKKRNCQQQSVFQECILEISE